MKHKLKFLSLALLLAISALVANACSTKNDFKALVKNVESYHRDLLFERYEIAAKNIAPSARASWLDSMQSQKIHFAEIEIASTEPCVPEEVINDENYDPEKCAVIYSQMQWFSNGSPSVSSGRVRSVWQFEREEKAWLIIEQEQK